ncbi:hypothetical protein P12x_003348 [Tundrisphaera lichenicola]|uniref:hypothetical protein n=1 Tax=Tundrisphaera lichenicola TaxID=2029860 RepID=UPI003EC0A7BA
MVLISVRARGNSGPSALLLIAGLALASTQPVRGQAPPTPSEAPKAVARFEGVASPGLRITLKSDGSTGRDLRFGWVQTEGPAVNLEQPEASTTSLVVPETDEPLRFLLIVGNAQGVSTAALTIPVEPTGAEARDPTLKADAGDDLLGTVGRQVTLNGIRSEPKGKVGFRWIQAGGPPVALKLEAGCYYTFVPTAPGVYQFALVIASGDKIAEPDYVSVTVGSALPDSPSTKATAPARTNPVAPRLPTEELTRASVLSISGVEQLAPELSRIFSEIAARMELYQSYEEAYSELSRRLDSVIPRAPELRSTWTEKLFVPLTLRMIETLKHEGLDLGRPEGQSAALTRDQRSRLAEHFRAMAGGLERAEKSSGPDQVDVRPKS